jgi:hypothetical protein
MLFLGELYRKISGRYLDRRMTEEGINDKKMGTSLNSRRIR